MKPTKRWFGIIFAGVLALGLLSLVAPLSTNAQLQTLRFHHLTPTQGLAHGIVLSILQDRQGFLWFGTQRGLNRYDGYNFALYRHSLEDAHSLSNDTVQALYEDSRGWLWIGSASGLDHLDPERLQVIRHPEVYESIRAFAEDDQGRLWIGSDGSGLYWYAYEDETFHSLSEVLPAGEAFPDPVINALYYAPDGTLWIGSGSHGLLAYNTLDIKAGWNSPIFLRQLLPFQRVTAINAAKDGSLWIGGGEYHEKKGGLLQFDPLRQEVIQIIPSFKSLHITSLLLAQNEILWIGSEEGLHRLSPNGQVETFAHDPLDPHSLSNDHITALFQDQSHNVWIATFGGGINRYSPASNRFSYYPSNFAAAEKAAYAPVGAVLKDRQGLIWVGYHGQGLAVYDRQQGTFTHYRHDPQDPTSLAHDHVTALYQDRHGDLWIGTQGSLERFDDRSLSFEHITLDRQEQDLPHPISVKVITEDQHGYLWAGLEDPGGLLKIDPDRKRVWLYGGQKQTAAGFPSTFGVRAIHADRQGNLWLGTYNGLVWFSSQQERWRQFRHNPNQPHSLSNDFVWAIHEAKDGDLWIGTHAGLNRLSFPCGSLDQCEAQWTVYTRERGLPDDSIVAILEDDQGNLWLGTMGGGLAVYDPALDQFRSFTEQDGLQSNAFVIGSAWRAEDGEMFFGGLKGFNAFYPQEVQDNPIPPPIVLTAFRTFDRVQEFSQDINHLQEIRIPSKVSFFAFEFAALDYSDPSRNQYAYKLEGFDREWVECGNRRYASYTNLPPGEYLFRVKGSNSDQIWNEEGKSIRLVITPAWYQTIWFRMAILVGALAMAGLYLHNRQRQIEALRYSEARYRALFESAPVGVCEADFRPSPPQATQYNPRWLTLFACPSGEKHSLDAYLPSEILERCRATLQSNVSWTTETSGRRWNGQTFPLRLSVAAAAKGDLSRCILVVEDLTAEKARRSEEEAIAEERRRIAREIHDGLAQDLAAIRLRVHRWQKWIESDPQRLWSELDHLYVFLGEKIREVRRAIFALRPVALDELGFWQALERFLVEFEEQNQLHTFLDICGDRHDLEPSLEPVLFRIIQEALHNVARHAQAQTVWLHIDLQPGVRLWVRDDGIGFDPAILPHLESKGHLGLQQMRERVESLGGSLKVHSQIGQGTEIEVILETKVQNGLTE
ncbi:MAG: two-component regulator propeller domain-containing protein [Anaerolineales bacterium]